MSQKRHNPAPAGTGSIKKRVKEVEPSAFSRIPLEKPHISESGAAKGAARAAMDADLRAVIDAWPRLPADVRKMIAGVVKLTFRTAVNLQTEDDER